MQENNVDLLWKLFDWQCAAHHGDNFVIKYIGEIETKF